MPLKGIPATHSEFLRKLSGTSRAMGVSHRCIGGSLLGVCQSAPYLFAGIWRLFISRKDHEEWTDQGIDTRTQSLLYKGYFYAIATGPMIDLLVQFREIQSIYGIFTVGFLPP